MVGWNRGRPWRRLGCAGRKGGERRAGLGPGEEKKREGEKENGYLGWAERLCGLRKRGREKWAGLREKEIEEKEYDNFFSTSKKLFENKIISNLNEVYFGCYNFTARRSEGDVEDEQDS